MERLLTIGRLAKAAGVAASVVRFYERERLLRPEGRSSGNYRLYGHASLKRLRFIRAAQATGFTLDDVRALLRFRDGSTATCHRVQGLIGERLTDLERRLEQLHHIRAVLRFTLKQCHRMEPRGRCQVIDTLRRKAGTPGRPKRRPR